MFVYMKEDSQKTMKKRSYVNRIIEFNRRGVSKRKIYEQLKLVV